MAALESDIVVRLRQFGGYIDAIRSGFDTNTPGSLVNVVFDSETPFQQVIKAGWDELGAGYLDQETKSANLLTMAMLLRETRLPKTGNSERWLSLGSGPGLYEAFLAKCNTRLTMDCLDLSTELNRVQSEVLSREPELARRVNVINADAAAIPIADDQYDQVLCINSLHWLPEWKSGVAEINRVLTSRKKARVYLVTASAPLLGGGQVARGMNTDTLLDEFRKYELHPMAIGVLNIADAQLSRPTKRFMAVLERSEQELGWRDRLSSGKFPYREYSIAGGNIELKTHLIN